MGIISFVFMQVLHLEPGFAAGNWAMVQEEADAISDFCSLEVATFNSFNLSLGYLLPHFYHSKNKQTKKKLVNKLNFSVLDITY